MMVVVVVIIVVVLVVVMFSSSCCGMNMTPSFVLCNELNLGAIEGWEIIMNPW